MVTLLSVYSNSLEGNKYFLFNLTGICDLMGTERSKFSSVNI